MVEGEAIGDVLTGAVVSRAIEPGAGEVGSDGHTHEQACLNCGATLTGPFCANCGQHGHVHRTLSAFFHDLLHGVFHFEGKIWNTLPLLALKPGELTRRYIDGQRASFVSPIALFLFSVFLMFAIVNATHTLSVPTTTNARQQMAENVVKDRQKLAKAQAARADAIKAHTPTAALDKRIASIEEDLHMEQAMVEKGIVAGTASRISDDVPPMLRDPLQKARDNPELVFYKLRNNAYKFSWALIPLSVPFMWLLFPFSRRFRLYDHTVFVTYSLCFMTLLVCVASLLFAVGLGALGGFAFFIPPVHMFLQLRQTYGLSKFGALWRTVALVLVSSVAMLLFAMVLFGMGMFE